MAAPSHKWEAEILLITIACWAFKNLGRGLWGPKKHLWYKHISRGPKHRNVCVCVCVCMCVFVCLCVCVLCMHVQAKSPFVAPRLQPVLSIFQ